MRQDLWVCHLSGIPLQSLDKSLEKINVSNKIEEFKEAINAFLIDPISDILLNNFTTLELSIIFLLALGHDIIAISGYKGIAEVRVRQLITNIQSSKVWDDIWHSKPDSQ